MHIWSCGVHHAPQAPKRVSDVCRDLLRRMLTPDPARRISVPDIMTHPWCATLYAACSGSLTPANAQAGW